MIAHRRRSLSLLLVNQFYPPDQAPTGRYLHDLARELAKRGHRVRVLCSTGDYGGRGRRPPRQVLDGVSVTRLPTPGFGRRTVLGRLADYAAFYLGAALLLPRLARRRDLVLALTTPPWIGAIAARAARSSGSRHAHWLMDLYPEALAANGHRRLAGWLAPVTRRQLAGAAGVAVPGPSVAAAAARHLPADAPRALTVPLWILEPPHDPARARALRKSRGWRDDDLVLMYSGNLGLAHPLEGFLAAASRLGTAGPLWVFAGAGRGLPAVLAHRDRDPAARIQAIEAAQAGAVSDHLASADVLLASMSSAWLGAVVPSKIQGMMAAGRPIIVIADRASEAACWVGAAGCGWVVPPGNIDALCAAVAAAADPVERARRAEAGLSYARARFGDRNRRCLAAALELWSTRGAR